MVPMWTARGTGPVAPTVATPLRPVDHAAVRLSTTGWHGSWQERNRSATIPHVLDHLENGEAWTNLARLSGRSAAPFRGMVFTDSDVYKALEAVAWSCADQSDVAELSRAQALVELVAAAREDDGYVNSAVQARSDRGRWSDAQWGHELYCAGHLFQAAVAAARCGVLAELVTVGTDFADTAARELSGANEYLDGHPQVEMALVELYRVTGEQRYLELARRQLDLRGYGRLGPDRFGSQYFLDHVPPREAREATGHAVRQLYLLCGMVDVAVETGDAALLAAADRVWTDLFATKTYVTGAHGSRHRDEAIGDPYELPPDRAYAETCAAIASFQLNWRLLLATGERRFADEMEVALFNAIAVATSDTGTRFFYSNPLQVRSGHDGSNEDAPSGRLEWFTCACCPPNLARLVASLHDYLITTSATGAQIHHPFDGTAQLDLAGMPVTLELSTTYPAGGITRAAVSTGVTRDWELAVRVPAWCAATRVRVDGELLEVTPSEGYLRIVRSWHGTHELEIEFEMPVRCISAHHRVDAVRGCVALARGPVVYALEQTDVGEADIESPDIEDLELLSVGPPSADLHLPVTLAGPVRSARLYATEERAASDGTEIHASLVPYYSWGNRGPAAMRVWLPTAGSRHADHGRTP
jgi:uncharacterized protein